MLKTIVSIDFFRYRCKVGYGTAKMTLDCGHTVYRKKSEVKPGQRRIKCHECTIAVPKS